MEVTTVSPSPASPTEGDDLCETDVTSVAIHSVTLLICLCGLAGNWAVIGLLSLKIRNDGILNLAIMDFLFLLFAVPSALLLLVEDVSCSPILPLMYLNFLVQLPVISYYWGMVRRMPRNIFSLIDILLEFCCDWKVPSRLLWVETSVQDWAFFSLFAVIPTATFLCPPHEQEHCRFAFISIYTIILLLFATPVVIFHTVDFNKAKWGFQQHTKRHDIVILITVLFTFLLSLCNFLQQLGYIVVSSDVIFLLACIHSSIKPFIYFLLGKCRRPCSMGSLWLSLQRVFDQSKNKPAHSNDPAMDTLVSD